MRISWGMKITGVFLVFAGLIGYMVYRCTETPVDLVTQEYYKDEIAYQQIIDGTKNANALSASIKLAKTNNAFTLQLPAEMNDKLVKGSVLFYCASHVANDRKFALPPATGVERVIAVDKIIPGNYIIKTEWWAGGSYYYNEQPFTIL